MYIAKQDEYKDVYCFNAEFEYTTTLKNELIQIGTGLPANSTLIEVIPYKEGFARLFNEDSQEWEYVEDHRGEKYYSTKDGAEIEIKKFGALPDHITAIPRPDEWHTYEGKARSWIMTEDRAQAKKEYEIKVRIEEIDRELFDLEQKYAFNTFVGFPVDEIKAKAESLANERLELTGRKQPSPPELEQGSFL